MWIKQPLEIQKDGQRTGRWRMTVTSDEDGGGPFGDTSHDHATPEEAMECERCDEFCAHRTGFMSRKRVAEITERNEREELARLKAKYESNTRGQTASTDNDHGN